MTQYLDMPDYRLAYVHTPGEGPTVVFLSGYKSDMEGTKALHLEAWAKSRGRAFLRLDYSGHGQSGGTFEDGCIGDWAADAQAVIEHATSGPLILVGSSMGGWIGSLLTQRLKDVRGFVGIAAAPDFTEDGFWAGFSEAERTEVMETGVVYLPSAYGDPYAVTRKLIEDGRENLVLRSPLPMPFPVRLVQGTEDEAVTRETALRLLDHIDSPDLRLTLVKGADHRFSEPENLTHIETAILEVGG
ncbi:alpha/beta hydrolase [Alloyangia pacifica]|uniref:Palmitoyl-protein thioesterase ABHD10, mitochondrial n=1 Tax=Alloyangia pacifica TaxID=311180 RepID=A0A2U8HB50_9RHOB|nr:alpha/beta hydrolase [Alloyangia pacifica]AWI83001.1 alpha/beta hydrolase [Alloyangia pacifica]